jgi:hypothetical protein
MSGLKTICCFVLFFIGFFAAFTLRFVRVIFPSNQALSATLPLMLIAAVSGVALAWGLASLGLFPKAAGKKIVYGSVLGMVFFLVFFGVEDFLSEKKLYSEVKPQSFSEVKGHCGVYIGRALIQNYRWNWNSSLPAIMTDFETSNRCRIHHFVELVKRNQIDCRPEEDQVQCLVRWMPVFAERGYWNADIRRMFLNEMDRVYKESKAPGSAVKVGNESYVEYALKDYELDAARPSLLKQAGLEEEFSNGYLYYRQLDDLQNIILTKEIFQAVADTLPKETAGTEESPPVLKFRDAMKEVSFKIEKIPELQKDLDELIKKGR